MIIAVPVVVVAVAVEAAQAIAADEEAAAVAVVKYRDILADLQNEALRRRRQYNKCFHCRSVS
jgi:hypothetical protein